MGCELSCAPTLNESFCRNGDGCAGAFRGCFECKWLPTGNNTCSAPTTYHCAIKPGAEIGPFLFAIPVILLSIGLLWYYRRKWTEKALSPQPQGEGAQNQQQLNLFNNSGAWAQGRLFNQLAYYWLVLWALMIGAGGLAVQPYCRVRQGFFDDDRFACTNKEEAPWYWVLFVVPCAIGTILIWRLFRRRLNGTAEQVKNLWQDAMYGSRYLLGLGVIYAIFVAFWLILMKANTTSFTPAVYAILGCLLLYGYCTGRRINYEYYHGQGGAGQQPQGQQMQMYQQQAGQSMMMAQQQHSGFYQQPQIYMAQPVMTTTDGQPVSHQSQGQGAGGMTFIPVQPHGLHGQQQQQMQYGYSSNNAASATTTSGSASAPAV